MKVFQVALVLVVVVAITTTSSILQLVEMVPIDRDPSENQTRDQTSKIMSIQDVLEAHKSKPSRLNKERICRLICRNNPTDGGKLCK